MTEFRPDQLAFLSRQMKANILDFANGTRNPFAPYGLSTLEIAIGLLGWAERTADNRGIDRTGDEWGPNLDEIRKIARQTLDSARKAG